MRHRLLGIVLAAIAWSGCAAGQRGPGEVCASTADCRGELICFDGKCLVPGACPDEAPVDCGDTLPGRCCPSATPFCCTKDGKCHENARSCDGCGDLGEACRVSADCCTGLTCQSGRCKRPPSTVCGNGRCEAGETSATCCRDCGCPAGSTCQAGQCKAPGTVLTWTVINNCRNGEDIQFRFFSQQRAVQWPPGGLVYVSKQGTTVTESISCNAGEQVCIGGDQPDHGLSWGVGIDNSQHCDDCCTTCTNGSVSYGPMICP